MSGHVEPWGRRAFLAASAGSIGAVLAACSGVDRDEAAAPPAAPTPVEATGAGAGTTAPAAPTTTASAAQIRARTTVPVLCYHQVREWTPEDNAYSRAVFVCPPQNFAAHLDALQDGGYTPISPAQYRTHLMGGTGLPDKAMMITLDDGKDNQIGQALPALTQRGMTATFFVMTVILGNAGWMTRDDVKRVADAGMTVGSHTWDHHLVTKYEGKDYRVQFDQPRELLRTLSGQPVTDFAYPHGAWNKAALPHLIEAGYTAAYQLTDQPIDPTHPELTLRRTMATSTWTGPQLLEALAKPV